MIRIRAYRADVSTIQIANTIAPKMNMFGAVVSGRLVRAFVCPSVVSHL